MRHRFKDGDPDNSIHLISAWASGSGLSLGQLLVDGKSNEITAVPKLLRQIEVKGATDASNNAPSKSPTISTGLSRTSASTGLG